MLHTGLGVGKPKPSASARAEHDLARVEAELKGSTASVLPLDLSVYLTMPHTSLPSPSAPIDLTSKVSTMTANTDRTRLPEEPITPTTTSSPITEESAMENRKSITPTLDEPEHDSKNQGKANPATMCTKGVKVTLFRHILDTSHQCIIVPKTLLETIPKSKYRLDWEKYIQDNLPGADSSYDEMILYD